MNEFEQIGLSNTLSDRYGREFVVWLLRECGIDITGSISYRSEKTAHELGLDLLHNIMYNNIEDLKLIISEQKTLEVKNGRGNRNTDAD